VFADIVSLGASVGAELICGCRAEPVVTAQPVDWNHARMVFSARVLQHRQFDEWLADQQGAVGDGT
jgi:hypothetical protein